MSIPLAAFCVITIWSTTALAVKWSMDEMSFLTAASLRMLLASVLCLVVLRVMRWPLPAERRALLLYLTTGAGLFCGLGGTYWAAQHLSSGLVAVGWGLFPLFSGVLALVMLREKVGLAECGGLAAALSGLWLACGDTTGMQVAVLPAMLVLLGVIMVQSLCMIILRRWGRDIPAFAATTGSIIVAAALFTVSWLLFDRRLPLHAGQHSWSAVLYLACIGNLLGLGAWTWLAQRVPAAKASLITLVTPVFAVLIGHELNAEPLTGRMVLGIAILLAGLALAQRPWQWRRTFA